MSKHDDDMVMVDYSSFTSISFHGTREVGYTWGEWRQMTDREQDDALAEFLFELVDVSVEDDE